MVSRIHVADIVSVVEASIERPEPGMVMNVADDLPSTRYEVSVTSRLECVLTGQFFLFAQVLRGWYLSCDCSIVGIATP